MTPLPPHAFRSVPYPPADIPGPAPPTSRKRTESVRPTTGIFLLPTGRASTRAARRGYSGRPSSSLRDGRRQERGFIGGEKVNLNLISVQCGEGLGGGAVVAERRRTNTLGDDGTVPLTTIHSWLRVYSRLQPALICGCLQSMRAWHPSGSPTTLHAACGHKCSCESAPSGVASD